MKCDLCGYEETKEEYEVMEIAEEFIQQKEMYDGNKGYKWKYNWDKSCPKCVEV